MGEAQLKAKEPKNPETAGLVSMGIPACSHGPRAGFDGGWPGRSASVPTPRSVSRAAPCPCPSKSTSVSSRLSFKEVADVMHHPRISRDSITSNHLASEDALPVYFWSTALLANLGRRHPRTLEQQVKTHAVLQVLSAVTKPPCAPILCKVPRWALTL